MIMGANDKLAAARNGCDDDAPQVHDQGTTDVPASEVANAAAESLHGARAVEEKYAQPDAKALPGGGTLVADPAGDNPEAGQLR
jgi:hypothetical protein